MIVDPNFLDHWKTLQFAELLDDPAAPLFILRLWAHCQNRRQWQFDNLSPQALKALCRFPGHANRLESSLTASGFVRRDGSLLIVCNWDDYNASLIAAWTNGKKGGRPMKAQEPDDNRLETHGIPKPSMRVEGSRGEKRRDNSAAQSSPCKSPKGDEQKPRTAKVYPRSFEEFYQAFPRHVGKEQALRAYVRSGKKLRQQREWDSTTAAAFLLEKALAYAKSADGQSEYCPYPATWLNQGRYDDDPQEWNRREGRKAAPGSAPAKRATRSLTEIGGFDDGN
jgi:hypothetical protein